MDWIANRRGVFVAKPVVLLAVIVCVAACSSGCSLGPRSLAHTRIPYNDAIKTTSEQQLLLNIVRLRYVDTPSSLAISAIADQQEMTAGLQAVPFFTSAGTGDIGTYRGSVLPQLGLSGASRPTLSYTPMDDEEFTRRLFSPISLEGVAYLSKTTWPISIVFRLYLENLNWVSNAETASGPTPEDPPVFAEFLEGVSALQRLQDRNLITLFHEECELVIRSDLSSSEVTASDAVNCVTNDIEIRKSGDRFSLIRKQRLPVLRVGDIDHDDLDWFQFTRAFKLNPELRTFELSSNRLDPFLRDAPANGLDLMDIETRSLLQVLFFASHGVQVPQAHLDCNLAPQTRGYDGQPFDWNLVVGDLFRVCSVQSKKPPKLAHVAVKYEDFWFYIDERDHRSKSTFALLLEVSRLELDKPKSQAPLLTLPIGR